MPFQVELTDDRTCVLEDAEAYAQEGALTTFFVLEPGRTIIDSWASRVASFRTADVISVRLVPPTAGQAALDRNAA